MKRMLAILGSPRESGNVAKLLQVAMDEGKRRGFDVTLLDMTKTPLAPCRGCMACRAAGRCVVEDGIAEIEQAVRESALIVMASPVYFANVPGPLKNLLDRLVGTLMDDSALIPKPLCSPKQRYILLVACGTPAPFDVLAGQSTGCLRAMDEALHISGMKRAGRAVFAGTRGKTELPRALEQKIRRLVAASVA